ncbi:hypothetical protein BCR34DRAFT_82723 [Clohesyomyces aquaticus]|uniref:Uncharacterized protein n=1 Tax=Clohesyomyces aquaticus TaxID=1231657 RepID=A0A1Y1YWP2_9PLEO|nr:hypothetical protein BCR34DRAFT_82723 [Clohesyomyces aquaticus]
MHLFKQEYRYRSEAIILWGRTSCQRLTRAMHVALPREMRDLVYEHLLDATMLWRLQCLVAITPWPEDALIPHIVDPTYVDRAIMTEVVEKAYKYEFAESEILLQDLSRRLWRDSFQIGLRPLDCIEKARVHWRIGYSTFYRLPELVKNDLGILKLLPRADAGFRLSIAISATPGEFRWEDLENSLQAIRPFHERGFRIAVVLQADTPEVWNLDEFFLDYNEAWVTGMKKDIDQVSVATNHYRCEVY